LEIKINKIKYNRYYVLCSGIYNKPFESYLPVPRDRELSPKLSGSYIQEVLIRGKMKIFGGLRDMGGQKEILYQEP